MLTFPPCSSRASDMIRSRKMLKRAGDRRHHCLTPIGVHHRGVSRAEFSLTKPIPLQVVYIDHSRTQRILYGSPWSETHGRWLKRVLPPWPLASSRKSSAQWCCVSTTPNWPIGLGDSLGWERLISFQQVIDLSTAYNKSNQTQRAVTPLV